jgi:hypothetical protein
MRKKKTYSLFNKIRAALRDVYRYSPMRKEAINAVKYPFNDEGIPSIYSDCIVFDCPKCKQVYPIQMADVDHEPPLGALGGTAGLGDWSYRLFYGNVQVICKLCHRRKTASQRKKVKK